MTIQMNSMFKSRIVSRTISTPILRFNYSRDSQKTNSNNNSRKNCRMISNLTNYSQSNNWSIGQGPMLYPPNLPRLGEADKNKLEHIGCVGIPQDSPLSPPRYNFSTNICTSAPVRPSPQQD